MVKGLGVHVASGASEIFAVEPHFTPDTFMTLVPVDLYVVEAPVIVHLVISSGRAFPEVVKTALPFEGCEVV